MHVAELVPVLVDTASGCELRSIEGMVVVLPFFGNFAQVADDEVTKLFCGVDVLVVVEIEAALHSSDGGHFVLHVLFTLGDVGFVTDAEVTSHSELEEL